MLTSGMFGRIDLEFFILEAIFEEFEINVYLTISCPVANPLSTNMV